MKKLMKIVLFLLLTAIQSPSLCDEISLLKNNSLQICKKSDTDLRVENTENRYESMLYHLSLDNDYDLYSYNRLDFSGIFRLGARRLRSLSRDYINEDYNNFIDLNPTRSSLHIFKYESDILKYSYNPINPEFIIKRDVYNRYNSNNQHYIIGNTNTIYKDDIFTITNDLKLRVNIRKLQIAIFGESIFNDTVYPAYVSKFDFFRDYEAINSGHNNFINRIKFNFSFNLSGHSVSSIKLNSEVDFIFKILNRHVIFPIEISIRHSPNTQRWDVFISFIKIGF